MEIKNPIIFNRETEKYFSIESGNISFNLRQRRTRLDQAAQMMTGAKPGMYGHFILIGDTYHFSVNDDRKGYKLHGECSRASLTMSNAKFIRHFFRKMKITSSGTVVFSLLPVDGKEFRGRPIFEIFKKIQLK